MLNSRSLGFDASGILAATVNGRVAFHRMTSSSPLQYTCSLLNAFQGLSMFYYSMLVISRYVHYMYSYVCTVCMHCMYPYVGRCTWLDYNGSSNTCIASFRPSPAVPSVQHMISTHLPYCIVIYYVLYICTTVLHLHTHICVSSLSCLQLFWHMFIHTYT